MGFRLAAATASIAALGIAVSVAAWTALRPEREGVVRGLREALDERAAAGRSALSALEEAAAQVAAAEQRAARARRRGVERRASELVLLAARGPVPKSFLPTEGERLGRIWLDEDRVRGLTTVETTTLSVAAPELFAALKAAPAEGEGPLLVRAGAGVYAVLAEVHVGAQPVAFVPLAKGPAATDHLADARAAVGNLAAPPEVPSAILRPEPSLAAAGLLVALLVYAWVRWRVSGPLFDTLEAARDFVHGDPGARADEARGGREAREVARAVNALVERAARLEDQGRAAREEDIQAAAVAIEGLGKGDLRDVTPRLGPPFGPVSRALDRARRDLLARVERLHEVSRAIGQEACVMAPAARGLASATSGQREALDRLADGLGDAERQMMAGAGQLEVALADVAATAEAQRRTTQELKATVSLVGRRLEEVSAASVRVRDLLRSAQSIEQGLAMLGTWAATGDPGDAERPRATQLVGEGRAALSEITAKLTQIREELEVAADSLETVGASSLEAPPDPGRAVSAPLFESANGLVRAGELLGRGLNGWSRSVRQLGQQTEAVAGAAGAASLRLGDLSEALSELRVGDAFEQVLLERLERARAEVEAAPEGALTADGAAMIEQVDTAAAAARARVGQLIRATEATLDVLRR